MATEVISLIMNFTDNVSKGLDAVTSKVDGFKGKVDSLASAFLPVSLAAGAALGASVSMAATFDKSVNSAAKAMDLSAAATDKFKKNVMETQKELKYAFGASALADIGAVAGKLGVAEKDMKAYVKTMATLAVATDTPKEKLDDMVGNMAKVSSSFKLNTKEVDTLGGSYNRLDDAFAVTSFDLIEFGKRTAMVTSQAKLSAQQNAALGATLINAGATAQTAASGINAIIGKLGNTTGYSTRAIDSLKRLGYTQDSLMKSFDKNATGTLDDFFTKINKLSTLDQRVVLGNIFGAEHSDMAALLASQFDNYTKAVGLANDATGNAAKLASELSRQQNSLAGQTEAFKNMSATLGIQLGQVLLPGLISVMKALTPLIDGLVNLTQQYPMVSNLIVAALGITALIAPLAMLTSALAGIVTALPIIGAGFAAVGAAIAAISTPALAVVGIIAAIGAAAYVIIKNWTPISGFFKNLWDGAITQANRFLTWVWEGGNKFEAAINRWFASLPTAINNAVKAGVNQINSFLNWLAGLGNNFAHMAESWGNGLIQGFINGMQSMYGNVQNAMNNFVNWLSQYLPHSDAKKGALSNLTASGQSFADTFLSGIEGAKIDPFGTLLTPALATSGITPMSAIGGMGSVNAPITVTYNISAKDADDIMKQIKSRDRELLDLIARATQRTDRRAY